MRLRRRTGFSVVVTGAVGLFLLLLSVPSVRPVLRAARADGVPGTFTAARVDCVRHPGHESCNWYGTFTPSSGGPPLADVALYGSDRGSLQAGQRVTAVDTGRRGRVYRPSGSNEWLATAGLLALGVFLLLPVGVTRRGE
jgi:hypothetical protein